MTATKNVKVADRFTPVDIARVHLTGTIGGHVDSAAKRLNKGQIERFLKVIEQGGSGGGWNGGYAGWWLEAALNSVGVEVDRRVGVIVDAERHRVVEVRRNAPGPRETVLEVVRPGYSIEGIRIRETDVVVKES